MKKIFMALLVALVAVALFVSCSGESKSEPSTASSISYESIKGQWKDEATCKYFIIFQDSNVANIRYYNSSTSSTEDRGTYTVAISGNVITFTKSSNSYSYECSLVNSKMTLKKQSSSDAIAEIASENWIRN